MRSARTNICANVTAVRQVLVRCILLYRRPAGRMDEAIARIAKAAGIEPRRVRNLYYDQITSEMSAEERHHSILGVCAARKWLASWLRAAADEIEADTALIEGAENQRFVREWASSECKKLNDSSAGHAA